MLLLGALCAMSTIADENGLHAQSAEWLRIAADVDEDDLNVMDPWTRLMQHAKVTAAEISALKTKYKRNKNEGEPLDLSPHRGAFTSLLKSWSRRTWEVNTRPLVVEVRSERVVGSAMACAAIRTFFAGAVCSSTDRHTFEYPPCDTSIGHPWLIAPWGSLTVTSTCEVTRFGARITAPPRATLSRLLVSSGSVDVRLVPDTYSWIYVQRLIAGSVFWMFADMHFIRAFAVVVVVLTLALPLAEQISSRSLFHRAGLVAAGCLIGVWMLRTLAKAIFNVCTEEDEDEGIRYDAQRGFFVKTGWKHVSPWEAFVGRLLRLIVALISRLVAMALLATSSADPVVGALAVLIALAGPFLFRISLVAFESRQPLSSYRYPLTERQQITLRSEIAKHTRASLADLRDYMQTPAGVRDISRLAPHPYHAAVRDLEIRHFIQSGDALHHNCHFRHDHDMQ